MLKLAADENFDNRILRGLWQRQPGLDIVRIQDTEICGVEDEVVLEWAAREGRILLTHDVNTMVRFAYERVRANQPMSGILEVHHSLPMDSVIQDILLLAEATTHDEWEDQVRYLPI